MAEHDPLHDKSGLHGRLGDDVQSVNREPFWGPNAKPMLVQTVVGVAVALTVYWLFGDFLYDLPCYVMECRLPARS